MYSVILLTPNFARYSEWKCFSYASWKASKSYSRADTPCSFGAMVETTDALNGSSETHGVSWSTASERHLSQLFTRCKRSTALSPLEHLSTKARILKVLWHTEATKPLNKCWKRQAFIMMTYEDNLETPRQPDDSKESLLQEFLEKRFAHLCEPDQSS